MGSFLVAWNLLSLSLLDTPDLLGAAAYEQKAPASILHFQQSNTQTVAPHFQQSNSM